MIAEVRERHPDALFLSEAFTRPKVMRYLAKGGFSQSYTYFTWRNTRAELTTYFTELTQTPAREYLRPNLFANTPDTLPEYLQYGGPAAFRVRRENPALHSNERLRFYACDNEQVLFYGKTTPDLSNIVLVVVNLDPHHVQSGWVRVPQEEFGLRPGDSYQVHDLLTGGASCAAARRTTSCSTPTPPRRTSCC